MNAQREYLAWKIQVRAGALTAGWLEQPATPTEMFIDAEGNQGYRQVTLADNEAKRRWYRDRNKESLLRLRCDWRRFRDQYKPSEVSRMDDTLERAITLQGRTSPAKTLGLAEELAEEMLELAVQVETALPTTGSDTPDQKVEAQLTPLDTKSGEDPGSYVAVSTLPYLDYFSSYRAFKTFLDKNPNIVRSANSSPQRLNIHTGDWMRFTAKRDQERLDTLDAPAEEIDKALAGVSERKAGILATKGSRK